MRWTPPLADGLRIDLALPLEEELVAVCDGADPLTYSGRGVIATANLRRWTGSGRCVFSAPAVPNRMV